MDQFKGCPHSEQMTLLMSLALDGLLGADDRLQLQQHLASCASCRSEWEAMKQMSGLLKASPMVGPPLGFAVRVERRLDDKARKQRRVFGGVAVLTSSLSLAGATIAVILLILGGLMIWQWLGAQGTSAVTQIASGVGLMGKGASLFLKDLLLRYAPALVLLLGISLAFLAGIWIWLFVKRPGSSHRNGYA